MGAEKKSDAIAELIYMEAHVKNNKNEQMQFSKGP